MKPLACSLLFLSLLLPSASAQKPSAGNRTAAANKLIALKATGTARYTDQEILAASGLPPPMAISRRLYNS